MKEVEMDDTVARRTIAALRDRVLRLLESQADMERQITELKADNRRLHELLTWACREPGAPWAEDMCAIEELRDCEPNGAGWGIALRCLDVARRLSKEAVELSDLYEKRLRGGA